MRNHLTDMRKILNYVDNDVRLSLNFLNDPRLTINELGEIGALVIPTKPEAISKMDIIFGLIRATVIQYDKPPDRFEIEKRVKNIYLFLDTRYDKLMWPLHDIHFHTDFGQFVNCPYTTASEISEVIEKILGEYFHA